MIELSAAEQAALVRDGRVSARDLVTEALEAIERANPELNAFVLTCPERALAEADAIEPGDARPLAGVPIAITERLRTAKGSDALPPDGGSAAVRKLREAGAIIVGKTNTPVRPTTEPARSGPTRNPWDPTGISGGSAAAVAAGMVALAHGGYAGDSIRIPAAVCGVVGLKPSRLRVPLGPELAEFAAFGTTGVLTRTVLDTALALDVLAAGGPETSLGPPLPSVQFADSARIAPHPLRIRVCVTPSAEAEVDPACVDAAYAAADLLARLGHEVDEWTPDWAGPVDPALLEPATRAAVTKEMAAYARAVISSWQPGSLLLTPTTAILPGPVDGAGPELGIRHSAFTRPFDITGQPAISLPLHRTAAGLPVGVQLAGPVGAEARLLSVAGQLEQAAPWPLTAAVRAG